MEVPKFFCLEHCLEAHFPCITLPASVAALTRSVHQLTPFTPQQPRSSCCVTSNFFNSLCPTASHRCGMSTRGNAQESGAWQDGGGIGRRRTCNFLSKSAKKKRLNIMKKHEMESMHIRAFKCCYRWAGKALNEPWNGEASPLRK